MFNDNSSMHWKRYFNIQYVLVHHFNVSKPNKLACSKTEVFPQSILNTMEIEGVYRYVKNTYFA